MGQNEAVESTGLYVMDLIQKLGENHSVTLGKLGDVLQGKINAPQPGALWFTLGPHTSLGDFIFELQALGNVMVGEELEVELTPQGKQLLAIREDELAALPAKLGLAA